MSIRKIAEHEAHHVLADAAAVCLLAPDRYADALLTIKVTADEGSVALEIGDVIESQDNLHLTRQCLALGSLGPCAAAGDDVLKMLKAQDWDALVAAGELSEADVTIFAQSNLPDPTIQVVRTLLAVGQLKRRIGLSGWNRLGKLLRDAHNQAFHDWRLAELVPEKAVRAALREIEPRVQEFIGAQSDGERVIASIKARTAAQEAVEQDHERRALAWAKAEAQRQEQLEAKP